MARGLGSRSCAFVAAVVLASAALVGGASGAPPDGVSMEGTGPPPPGVGLLSKQALAQEHCSPQGQTWTSFEGGGPWCVNPWPAGKKNGGATAQGVTADSVHIIAYVPSEQMLAANTSPKPTDNATQRQATPEQAYRDFQTAFDYAVEHNNTYQLWGRKPRIELFTASGTDEASQRADAVAVIAKKPFMVVDVTSTTTGAPTFASAVAAKKIVVASASTDLETAEAQAPYRWNITNDPASTPVINGTFIGKSLSGKKARWAGDELASKTRVFGAVYPTNGTVDIDEFDVQVTKNGGKLTEKLGFDATTATSGGPELGTIISKLKSSGVTSVVLFGSRDVNKILMAIATEQGYFPEWIFTGTGFQEFAGVTRTNDQQQMAHAFGLGQIGPYLTNDPRVAIPTWYFGPQGGTTWSGASSGFEFIYNALHYAGPTLTAENVRKGLFAAPSQTIARTPAIGKWGYGRTTGTPYDAVGANGSDRALMWWDPDAEGYAIGTGTAPGKGVWMFLNNGESVGPNYFTKAEPKFFDPSSSVNTRDALDYYGGVAPKTVPCTGCPSSGATSSPS